jgi:hypothetical protein
MLLAVAWSGRRSRECRTATSKLIEYLGRLSEGSEPNCGSAMQPAKKYQGYAARCLHEARTASDPELKELLVEMAEEWQSLINQAKVGGSTTSSEPKSDN